MIMIKKYRRTVICGVLCLILGSIFLLVESEENNFKHEKENVDNKDSKLSIDEPIHKQAHEKLEPCTALHPLTHNFIDLRGLSPAGNDGKPVPWTVKEKDSGHNFTIGICSNPFKKHHDEATDIQDEINGDKIGAFYRDPKSNKYVSIGEFSTTPTFHGKRPTLVYENGSKCNGLVDTKSGQTMKKSTIINFTCDRNIQSRASFSYLGSFNDCNYIFEVRSIHACPTAAKESNLAAIWIFLLILCSALAVYFSGGILYRHMKSSNSKF